MILFPHSIVSLFILFLSFSHFLSIFILFLSASSLTHPHRKMNFSSTNFKRTFRLLLWKNGRKELEKNKIEVQRRVSERNRDKMYTFEWRPKMVEDENGRRTRKRRGLIQIRSYNNSIHSSSIFLSFQTRCNSTILCNEQSSHSISFSVFLSLTLYDLIPLL